MREAQATGHSALFGMPKQKTNAAFYSAVLPLPQTCCVPCRTQHHAPQEVRYDVSSADIVAAHEITNHYPFFHRTQPQYIAREAQGFLCPQCLMTQWVRGACRSRIFKPNTPNDEDPRPNSDVRITQTDCARSSSHGCRQACDCRHACRSGHRA